MENQIEPKIKPLVDAMNNTKICWTFSSCQGHYCDEEQEFSDRNRADVRFDLKDGVSNNDAEHFMTYLITEFTNRHGFSPVIIKGYKLYAPDDDYSTDYVYVVELSPFDRFETPTDKRNMTDKAILQATTIVNDYNNTFPSDLIV